MLFSGRWRALLVTLVTGALCAVALPARADSPSSSVGAARQNLAQAQAQAQQAATALGAAQQQLAGAQQQLASEQTQITTLDAQVATDAATVDQLSQRVAVDKASLSAYLRTVYKSGGAGGALTYILASTDIGVVFQRIAEMDRVDRAGGVMLARIATERAGARQALSDAGAARAQAEFARQRALTTEALVSVEADRLASTAAAANTQLSSAHQQYTTAVAAAAAAAAQAAAAQAAAAQAAAAQAAAAQAATASSVVHSGGGRVFVAVPGPLFTVDTDLTQPSGETPARLDAYLGGTPLASLGGSFVQAESTYHVSARYLVAHAILESAFGTSAIAHDKHNLFGYGANDANPYGDAKSFPSFDACIQFVARMVAQNYLSPGGSFYHGPTLRGMNVNYASDPGWADKIARIASTVPV